MRPTGLAFRISLTILMQRRASSRPNPRPARTPPKTLPTGCQALPKVLPSPKGLFALGRSWVCLGYALICLGYVLGVSWVCLGYALDRQLMFMVHEVGYVLKLADHILFFQQSEDVQSLELLVGYCGDARVELFGWHLDYHHHTFSFISSANAMNSPTFMAFRNTNPCVARTRGWAFS